MRNERDAWRREGALHQSEELSVCLKSFVSVLTDVSRWPCQDSELKTGGLIENEEKERASGEQGNAKHEKPQRRSAGVQRDGKTGENKNPLNFSQQQPSTHHSFPSSLHSHLPLFFSPCYFLLKITPRRGTLLGGSPPSTALVPRTLVII